MEPDKKQFWDEWGDPLVFGGLTVACLLIYAQTTGFAFINLDDPSYVYKNQPVLNGLSWETIKWSFTAFHSSNWHPLTWLSHALDVQIFGLNAGAHHAINVVMHLANSCLAFMVFRAYTGSTWKSAVVAFLFAVHPAHVESVAWVSERKDVLSTFFWLLTMAAYVRYVKSPVSEGSIVSRFRSSAYAMVTVCFVLGLLSKPMLVTLPFALLLLDIWPLHRISDKAGFGRAFIEKIPLIALSAASSVVTFMAQSASGSVRPLEAMPIESRILNSVAAYVNYIGMLFYPSGLGVWYPFEPFIPIAAFVAMLACLVGVTAIAIWQLGKRPYIAVGWFWYLGTLVPVIGLVQVGAQSMADRYTYVPYFGLFIIGVWGVAELAAALRIDRRVVAAAAVLAIVALTTVAMKQVSYWRNNETLYTRSIEVTRENYFLRNLLCRHYFENAAVELAERRCVELVGSTSNYMESHNTIGLMRAILGRHDDALASYRKALEIKPDAAVVYLNMAVSYAEKRDPGKAEAAIAKATEIGGETLNDEALARAYRALSTAYSANGDPKRAAGASEAARIHESRANQGPK